MILAGKWNATPAHCWRSLTRLLLVGLIGLLGGCRAYDIDTAYGGRSGTAGRSVNGTTVLASMFRSAGHKITTLHRISPRLEHFDVIVWAPDEFTPPNQEQRVSLERWLANGNRTLIYVGRDYDAAPEYWQRMAATVTPEKAVEMWKRRAAALATFDSRRAAARIDAYGRWFTRQGDADYGRVSSVTANNDWLDDVDVSQLEIFMGAPLRAATKQDVTGLAGGGGASMSGEFDPFSKITYEETQRQLQPATEAEVLLETDRGPLVSRIKDNSWRRSNLLVVSNGSFLLNLPLVNTEHRKLAGKLITVCGSGTKKVAFLETNWYEGVSYGDESSEGNAGMKVFSAWPLGLIVMHAILAGIIACFALFPIFGRARQVIDETQGDFGKHIEALGNLLQRTKDDVYARDQLQLYYRQVRGETEERA